MMADQLNSMRGVIPPETRFATDIPAKGCRGSHLKAKKVRLTRMIANDRECGLWVEEHSLTGDASVGVPWG